MSVSEDIESWSIEGEEARKGIGSEKLVEGVVVAGAARCRRKMKRSVF